MLIFLMMIMKSINQETKMKIQEIPLLSIIAVILITSKKKKGILRFKEIIGLSMSRISIIDLKIQVFKGNKTKKGRGNCKSKERVSQDIILSIDNNKINFYFF